MAGIFRGIITGIVWVLWQISLGYYYIYRLGIIAGIIKCIIAGIHFGYHGRYHWGYYYRYRLGCYGRYI